VQTSTEKKLMKIRNLIFFLLISILLSGSVIAGFISVHDKEEISMPINQSPLQVSESYNAASVSEGTAMLLFAVGVIGVLGIRRKKKELGNPAQRNETNREPNLQNMNEDR
jgi:phosphotransferase system  glucose/maltose/N-acetylglucosamine-specific IIC component